jgi:hypothetical protein
MFRSPFRSPCRSLVVLALLVTSLPANALKNAAPAGVSLEGHWQVNTAQSDDGEAMLAQRREEQMKRMRKEEERHRRRMRNDPFAWEPEFTQPERTPQRIAAMEERERRTRQMLGMTKFLNIEQDERGTKLTITSEYETRRLEAGSRSQVSLPQGQLADSQTGWDGEWFVIDRDADDGPRITEKYRLLKKSDQLETLVTIRGESMLAGMKLRRVFDRAPAEARASTSAEIVGPVR